MSGSRSLVCRAAVIAGLAIIASGIIAAPSLYAQGGQSQPPAQQGDKPKTPEATPLTLDAAAPVAPTTPEEEAAYKVFHDTAVTETNKKIELGEAFLQKYPQSRYRPPIYASLAYQYLQVGKVDKMREYGEKEIELTPNDVSTLALLGQTLPRSIHGNPPDAAQTLTKAEKYSKQAIEITPTLPKPAELSDDQFEKAKNQTLAMAHSGLGLIFVRRGKYAEAIPELEQSIKIDVTPDPVNYYLLGLANKSTSHFDDAVTAFNKCAALPGTMQTTCKSGAEDAKKAGSTQLSAPK